MAQDAWSAKDYARHARFVSDLGAPVLELLDPQIGEHILDLGCGDGVLTRELMHAGATVVGVDASPDMIAKARADGIDAHVMDAHDLTLDGPFDAVFSNAAMHWMTKPDLVLKGIARCLKPGGRLVAEFGGMGNVAAIRTAIIAVLARDFGIKTTLHDIWYFPSVGEHSTRLEEAGFEVTECQLIPRPTPIKSDMRAWLSTLAAPALQKLPETDRDDAAKAMEELLAPALQDAGGNWTADYIRLRFKAVFA
ncbi:methyltransferase domain-containing protein [Rhodobacteraceae bacterium NNCM2]|nr:methyltransferase domain-containing protein [Coraliihabitans acroporae]